MTNNHFNWERIKNWLSANSIYILAIIGAGAGLLFILQILARILMFLAILIGGSR